MLWPGISREIESDPREIAAERRVGPAGRHTVTRSERHRPKAGRAGRGGACRPYDKD